MRDRRIREVVIAAYLAALVACAAPPAQPRPGSAGGNVTVEHPELVAMRIERFAGLVGRVIAGVDCGFMSTATTLEMPESIVWAKLGSLVEGARIASARLWA